MDIKEIIAIFREIAVHESEYVPSFTVTCLLEVEVIMENNHKITVLCGESEIVDCSATSPDGYLGIGDILINPISDIEDIHLKMR